MNQERLAQLRQEIDNEKLRLIHEIKNAIAGKDHYHPCSAVYINSIKYIEENGALGQLSNSRDLLSPMYLDDCPLESLLEIHEAIVR